MCMGALDSGIWKLNVNATRHVWSVSFGMCVRDNVGELVAVKIKRKEGWALASEKTKEA